MTGCYILSVYHTCIYYDYWSSALEQEVKKDVNVFLPHSTSAKEVAHNQNSMHSDIWLPATLSMRISLPSNMYIGCTDPMEIHRLIRLKWVSWALYNFYGVHAN